MINIERNLFNEYMRECGIDPDNPKSECEKLALPIAFGAWNTQQLRIDEMKRKVDRFKSAFNSL